MAGMSYTAEELKSTLKSLNDFDEASKFEWLCNKVT